MRVTKLVKQQVNLVRDAVSDGDARMSATDLLEMQHRKVEMIFGRIQRSRSDADKRSMLEELADNLVAHMVIEEEIFYPACQRALDKAELIIESFEEHELGRFALRRLLATRVGDKAFNARVKALRELIEDHIREEESKLFPKAERKLGKDRNNVLGDQMRERFHILHERGYRAVLEGEAPRSIRTARSAPSRVSASGGTKRAAAKRTSTSAVTITARRAGGAKAKAVGARSSKRTSAKKSRS